MSWIPTGSATTLLKLLGRPVSVPTLAVANLTTGNCCNEQHPVNDNHSARSSVTARSTEQCCKDVNWRGLSSDAQVKFRLNVDTVNPYVKNMEYAVRGKMPQEALKIEEAIKKVSRIAVLADFGDALLCG